MKTISTFNLDYEELGLACGLELHQQLDTHKLFCNCPSKIINDSQKPDRIIKRKLRAVSSESGQIDITAKQEQKKDKTLIYHYYNSCNCLVETDSQPPFPINKEALKTAVIISKLTNSNLVDKSYVMRKQVIDGTNVSGFQRTAMISTQGYLDFDFGRVRIDKILLEEDSARPIERSETQAIYSLDRLGVPLIEMVAWHDIHTAKDVKKVAMKLGEIFRITGKCKRGLGTIRQDINISIKDGARVEIKGTQDLNLIPEIVDREIVRQINLLQVRNELKSTRGIKEFNLEFIDLKDVFEKTESKLIKKGFSEGKNIYGFKLNKMQGILGFEIQPDRRVGSELASVLKAKTSLKGLFHSDELPNYGVTVLDVDNCKLKLQCSEEDAFILLICKDNEIEFVKECIENRLNKLLVGIPKETRVVTPEGNTNYQRPLSTGARMYPETDIKVIEFKKDFLKEAYQELPRTVKEREEFYRKEFSLSEQLISKMVLSNYAVIFEKIMEDCILNPTTVAVFLLEDITKFVRDHLVDDDQITKDKLLEFFNYENLEKIPSSKKEDLFVYFIRNNCDIKTAVDDLKIFEELSNIDTDQIIEEVLNENKDQILKLKERAKGLVMGRFMAKAKGLVDGKQANEIVTVKLQEFLENNQKANS